MVHSDALTVVEASNILGMLAGVLLLSAIIAWAMLVRRPLMRRTDGSTVMDSAQGELASELLFWALGLSSVAALLAIAALIFG